MKSEKKKTTWVFYSDNMANLEVFLLHQAIIKLVFLKSGKPKCLIKKILDPTPFLFFTKYIWKMLGSSLF